MSPDAFQDRIAANIALPKPGERFAASATAHLERGKLKRLAVVSVVGVGVALALAFPIFVQLMLGCGAWRTDGVRAFSW